MTITLTSNQYSAIDATPGAAKRISAACTPLEGDQIQLAVGLEVRRVLEAVNAADLADAATRVRWTTLRGGALHCQPKAEAAETPAVAPQMPQDAEVAPAARVTKGTIVLGLLQREGGATNAEMMQATGWQTHSVRGFLAGKQLKAMGFKAVRTDLPDGRKVYSAQSLVYDAPSADDCARADGFPTGA